MKLDGPEVCAIYAKRANASRRGTHCIEGEYVTLDQMAARMGVTRRAMTNRLSRARSRHDVVTWETLR